MIKMRCWELLFICLLFYPVLSQKNNFDSVSIASHITYSKKLPFIDYATNELEYYTIDAIKPFFEKLKNSTAKQVSILHIGDSHIQYDQGPGVIRNTFQDLFGFSGRGFVFPYASAGTHAAYDYKTSSTGIWSSSRNVSKEINHPIGVSGATIYTTDSTAGFSIQFYNLKKELDVVDKINLFVKNSDSSFHLNYRLSSSEEWIPIAISNSPFKSDFVEVILPRQFEKFIEFKVHKIDSTQKEFELYGIQLINSKNHGVLYNSVGINGASLVSFLKQDLFKEQLQKAKPDLIILDFGTNDLAGGKFDSLYFTTNLTKSIQRIRSVLPEVCILIPSIQDFTVNGKNISVTSDYSKFVRGFVKKNDVALYDYFWISGAKKSMKKWLNAGIAKSDQIHLTQSGYVLKGELYGNAILNSFARYLAKPQDSLLFERKVYEKIVEDTLIQKDSTTSQIIKKEKEVEPKPFVKEKTKVNTNVPKPKPQNTTKSYVVRKGDTLSSIARKHNTTVAKIKAKNKLKSDNLRIGQKLILP